MEITIYDPLSTRKTRYEIAATSFQSDNLYYQHYMGQWNVAQALSGIFLLPSGSTMTNCYGSLYGIQ